MRIIRWLALALVLVALLVTSVGWALSARDPHWARFDSCAVDEDGFIEVTFTYDLVDRASPQMYVHDGVVVIALRTESMSNGPSALNLGHGTASFYTAMTPPERIEYPDGSDAECVGTAP